MSLREEMWKYEQITGESAEHVPIIKLGAFLDGYEMGIKALEQTRWIPLKTRPMTEEEKEEIGFDFDYMYDCPLPDYGQEVLITDCYGNVEIDTFYRDYDGVYFEENCDDGEVVAWMPLPQPYTESEDKK